MWEAFFAGGTRIVWNYLARVANVHHTKDATMANKEKLLLMAMISMILPGAMQEAYADSDAKTQRKSDARSIDMNKRSGRSTRRSNTREIDLQAE
jgi:hypothetical protein